MTQAILYARFSPRKNAEESESIEFQFEKCRAYCKEKGYSVAGKQQDKALSGADYDRPGLWLAVESLDKDYVLVVHKLDRLARDVYLSELIHREVAKIGAKIETVDGTGNGDNPEFTMVRQVLQAFAEYERKVIARRTKLAMRRMQKMGKSVSSRPPYGWEFDPDSPMRTNKDGKPTVRERMRECAEEQRVIKRIVKFRAKGMGLRAICRALEKQGIKHRGGSWYHQQVSAVLKREGVS